MRASGAATALLGALLCALPPAAGAAQPPGTFSIVAYDPRTGELGVAVQSRAFAVGTRVAWARAGAGAVATQATTNASYGPRGLELLARGLPASFAIESLLVADPGHENRQVGMVNARGQAASYTGSRCSEWAGGVSGDGFAVQGNLLAGEAVVQEMARAFRETAGELSERLLAALAAGHAAGGDRRGQQSAALLVVRPSDDHPEYRERYVDLRVDDHPAPITELRRLYRVHEATGLAQAHLRYATAYERQGRAAEAEHERGRVGDAVRRALADSSSSPAALNALAWALCTHDVFLDEALAAARRAQEREPRDADVLDTVAECHSRRGEHAEAVRAARAALALRPDDPQLRIRLERWEEAALEAVRGARPSRD